MTRGSFIPPADLLRRLDGIEPTLERSRRLGAVGWTAAALSTAQLLLVVFSNRWWSGLSVLDRGEAGKWALVGSVAALVVGVSLINWTRLWVRESRQPFRYTFSIDLFQPIEGTDPEPRLAWLREDLAERLSERIRRMSLLDSRYSEPAGDSESHIHIGGSYGIRDNRVEVFPWIRLGGKQAPATLAHPIRFSLEEGGLRPTEDPAAYYKLAEWLYFSIASPWGAQSRPGRQSDRGVGGQGASVASAAPS